jgi:UDP-glucose:(heptosyl)LPS alpha-1,3-glucosyltransferase
MTEKPNFQDWYGTQDERFHYIPPYLSSDRFKLEDRTKMRTLMRDAFNFAAKDFVFMLTGSGFAMKGLDRAILAMAALPQNLLRKTKLVAIGQDNPKQFMLLAEKAGIKEHIVISKGRPDIPQLMQGADVCVHPAYRENTGLVILEAMACGTPILVTESCGYARHVEEANAGLVSALPFNQDDFNTQWLEMRQSKQKEKWAKNGLSYVETIMQANDGSAEAEILIRLASAKQKKTS